MQPSVEGGNPRCPHCGVQLPGADSPAWRAVAPLRTGDPPGAGTDPAAPAPSGQTHSPTLPGIRKSNHRKILILGSATLLLLGGLVLFIASKHPGKTDITERNISNKRELNEYFTKLINEGKTSWKDLDAIAAFESFGGTFIGLTRDPLPWREAETLAKRTGGSILDLSQLGTARQEIINWLGRAHPESLGKTTWILDGAGPLGIDSPDYASMSTLDRPRRAFIFWPGNMPTGWEWAINPRFDEALPFEAGVARVRIGDKWGLIDGSGKQLHAPALDFIGEFSEHGCAPIYQGDAAAIETLRQERTRRAVGMPGPEVPAGVARGLIDRTGKVLARTEWEDIQNHINGFTPVKRDGKWGYLDHDGKLAIPCKWDDAWRFSAEGFAVVVREGKRGIIDRTGGIIVKPEWDGAINFCKEGIGAVRQGSGWALVGDRGEMLTKPVWQLEWKDRRFDLGFIPATSSIGWGCTLLDKRGKQIFGMKNGYFPVKKGVIFTQANGENIVYGDGAKEITRFSGKIVPAGEGRLRVEHGKQFGFLDENGDWAIPSRNGRARKFTHGLVAVSTETKWGFMNASGETVVPEEWDEVRDFSEECAAVRRGGLWGFVDRFGKTIALPRYSKVGDFSCGVAAVTEENGQRPRWEFIDSGGSIAFDLGKHVPFHGTPRFFGNRLWVGGHGVIDPSGKLVSQNAPGSDVEDIVTVARPGNYHDRHGQAGEVKVLQNALGVTVMAGVKHDEDSESGLIPHALPPKYGLMDTKGKVLVEPRWDEIRILSPEWVWIGQEGKCGIADAKGNVVLEPVWNEVRAISPDWLWIRKGEKCGLADSTGKVIVEPAFYQAEVLRVSSASIAESSGELLLGPEGLPIHSPWIRVRDGKTVKILSSNGQPAIPPRLERAEFIDFYGPKHVVLVESGDDETPQWSLYESSTDTKTAFPDAERLFWNWHMALSGLLWIQDRADSKWKLMRADGKNLAHSQDAKPDEWELRDGIGLLQDGKGWFFVNGRGERIGGDGWTNARPFREGRAAVERNGKWGFIDAKGAFTSNPQWDEVRDYHQGRAAFRSGERWGYLDSDGKVAIVPVWDFAMDFEEYALTGDGSAKIRFATVSALGKSALLNSEGLLLCDPNYTYISYHKLNHDSFGGGNATSYKMVGNKTEPAYHIIRFDQNGKAIIEETGLKFDHNSIVHWPALDRYWAMAPDRSGWTLFGHLHKPLTKAVWDRPFFQTTVDPFSNGAILARTKNQKYGLLRHDGSELVPAEFKRIGWVGPGAAAAWSDNDGGLLDADGRWLFRDNDRFRIARFGLKNARTVEPQHRHGLVVIEDTPKWGYARIGSSSHR